MQMLGFNINYFICLTYPLCLGMVMYQYLGNDHFSYFGCIGGCTYVGSLCIYRHIITQKVCLSN